MLISMLCLFHLVQRNVLKLTTQSPQTKYYQETHAKKRMQKLKALHEETQKELTTYAWVDKNKGLARIPIDRAMEVAVAELAQKKPAPAGPIAAPAPQAAPAGASPTPGAPQGAALSGPPSAIAAPP